MLRLSLVLALAVLIAPLAHGQEADPKAAGDALVAGLTEADDAMCGKQHFSLLVDGNPGGSYVLDVRKADGKKGVAYVVDTSTRMTMGATKFRGTDLFELDSAFSVVSGVLKEEQHGETKIVIKEVDMARVEGGWTYLRIKNGKRKRGLSTSTARHYGHPVSMMLVARKLAGRDAGTVRLSGMRWPKGEAFAVDVEINAPAEFAHRDKKVQAQKLLFKREGGFATIVHVDAAGKVLEWGPENAHMRLVAGTREQVEAQADAKAPEAKGTPLAAVVVYFEVLAKARPVKALDAVMDWAAIQKEMAEENEDIAALTPTSIGEIMKAQFEKSPAAFDAATIPAIRVMLEETIEGDTAVVIMQGKPEEPFRLAKVGGAWKITHFPH